MNWKDNLKEGQHELQEEMTTLILEDQPQETQEIEREQIDLQEVKELLADLKNFQNIQWDRNVLHKNQLEQMMTEAMKEMKATQELSQELWKQTQQKNNEIKEQLAAVLENNNQVNQKVQSLIASHYQKNVNVMDKALEVITKLDPIREQEKKMVTKE